MPPSDARVVIVDDHELLAQALELSLRAAGYRAERIELPTGASTGALIATVLGERPQVLLLDLDLGSHGDGFALIEPATRAGIDVVVVTGSEDPGRWARAVMLGARKVVAKSSSLSSVVLVVERILDRLAVMTADESQALLDAWVQQRAGSEQLWARFDQLTMRESQVLGLLMQGHAVREVARQGNTAETTVRTQVKAILAKLEVSSQLAAVGLAYRIGWQAPFDQRVMS